MLGWEIIIVICLNATQVDRFGRLIHYCTLSGIRNDCQTLLAVLACDCRNTVSLCPTRVFACQAMSQFIIPTIETQTVLTAWTHQRLSQDEAKRTFVWRYWMIWNEGRKYHTEKTDDTGANHVGENSLFESWKGTSTNIQQIKLHFIFIVATCIL